MELTSITEKNQMTEDVRSGHFASKSTERGQWANKREFILAIIGEIIGLGNVWRFPYLCFKNGGGVFLVPYVLMLLCCGIPIFFLEVSLGQLTGQGGITCWKKLCPLLEGLGFSSVVILLYSSTYYIIILAWAFFYLFSSFHSVLPWASCNNTWNTGNCIDSSHNESFYGHTNKNVTSSVNEFWQRRVLSLSGGIEEMGGMRWDLAGCLLVSWVICYFCIWKGVKSSGKVVYFTATFPYVMLIALLIRGLTLPGAADGIQFYLYPDPTRLADPQVWMDAGSQILFSYAVCAGCLPALGSYNKYNNNCYKDAFALCTLNSLTSFVAGFAVFSVLGFMSYELGVEISSVAESGPGLAFITYPRAVAMMPFPQVWAAAFFLMIIFLGLDTQFVYLEGMVTSISDMYPSFFFIGHRRKLLLLLICCISFIGGLFMVTEGGLYIFLLFDYYACSGIPIMFFAILESCSVGWIFDTSDAENTPSSEEPSTSSSSTPGPSVPPSPLSVPSVPPSPRPVPSPPPSPLSTTVREEHLPCRRRTGADRYYGKIKEMIGYHPSAYMKYCWRFFTPVFSGGILIFSLVMFIPLRYNKTYHYPPWGYALGIFFALSSALLPPLFGLCLMTKTPGTIKQRLKILCTPAAELLKPRSNPEAILLDTVSSDVNGHKQ